MNKAEITIQDIIHTLLRHIAVILLVAAVFGFVAWAYTTYKVPKVYRTTVTFYALTDAQNDSTTITSSQQSVSRQLASTYSYILKTNYVMKAASAALRAQGVNYSFSQLKGMTAVATTNTELFTATITTTDRKNIKLIADTIADVAVLRIKEIVGNGTAKILDYAEVPGAPFSPDVKSNTITGALIGFLLACAVVVIRALTDTTIWSEEDLVKQYNIPVLGSIPQLSVQEKQTPAKE